MQQFPQLETARLLLNQLKETDIDDLCAILNSEVYSVIGLYPYQRKSAESFINYVENCFQKETEFHFAIRWKDTQKIVGAIGLMLDKTNNKAEMGYWTDEKFWQQGIATEAAKAVTDFGFRQLHLKRIYATHVESNTASGKVMQKIGMTQEGILRCHIRKNDVYFNHVMYSIIK